VHRILKGARYEKRIERRTTRQSQRSAELGDPE